MTALQAKHAVDPPLPEPVRTRLLLLHHAAVDWTHMTDGEPSLTDAGRLDAELTAAALPHFDVIGASPQRAAAETAEAIAAYCGKPVIPREGLEEIRPGAPLVDSQAYEDWIDHLFGSPTGAAEAETLADGTERMVSALRAIGDRYYGRSILIIGHPIILLAFRAHLLQTAVLREQVDSLPDLALAIVDYLEGRFYLVADFPIRQVTR